AWSYWHTSPAWFLWRLAATLGLSGALMVLAERWPLGNTRLAPLALLGRHSLMIYMVSVELTYGLLTGRLHGKLVLGQSLAGMAVMILLCLGLSWWAERRYVLSLV